MFRNAIKVARLFGIDIEVDLSWFIVFFLFSYTLSVNYFPQELPDLEENIYRLLGIGVTLVVFASVLVHELAHSLVAVAEGIPISKITLFIFGGVAQMKREPDNPRSELRITLVGPLSSIILAAAFGITFLLLPVGQPLTEAARFLARVNLVVGIINLIPAFPLDGGRVLRAILWMWKDNLLYATRTSVLAGSLFAFFAMGMGFVILLAAGSIWGLWYIFLGWLLYQAGQSSLGQVAIKESLMGIKIAEVMSREVVTVPPDLSISQLVEKFYHYKYGAFPVTEESRLQGLVTLNQVKEVARDRWEEVTVQDIMTPRYKCAVMGPEEDAVQVMLKMASEGVGRVLVVENNQLVGILSRTDVMRLINMKMLLEGEPGN